MRLLKNLFRRSIPTAVCRPEDSLNDWVSLVSKSDEVGASVQEIADELIRKAAATAGYVMHLDLLHQLLRDAQCDYVFKFKHKLYVDEFHHHQNRTSHDRNKLLVPAIESHYGEYSSQVWKKTGVMPALSTSLETSESNLSVTVQEFLDDFWENKKDRPDTTGRKIMVCGGVDHLTGRILRPSAEEMDAMLAPHPRNTDNTGSN